MWTPNDEQETLSSTEQEEEEKAIYSSYLFDQFQIKQDIPQDSAQEGSEHRDKETDNQERLFKKIIIMNLRESFKRLLKNLCKELLLWLSLPM